VATFETVGHPFEERKMEEVKNVSDPYAEDFPSIETYLEEIFPTEPPGDDVDGDEESSSQTQGETLLETLIEEETGHQMRHKNHQNHKKRKSTKVAKAKKAGKGTKAKKAKKKDTKTISPMPTMTPRPTSSPTASPYPTVSPFPSQSPTVTPRPSVPPSPSSSPIVSPNPTLAGSDEAAETFKRPLVVVAKSEPEERTNKFAIWYELEANANQPENGDYDETAYETSQYLDNSIKTYYDDFVEVIFVGAGITIWNEPSPLVVDFDAVSYFNGSSVPTTTELDGVIWNAFSSATARYIDHLKYNLDSTNPLSKTKSIKFAPYWTALASQKEKAAQASSVETSNSDTATTVSLVAVGATLVVVGGLLIVVRHRKMTAAVNDDDDDYSRRSGNLHVKNGRIEEDTLILDDQSVGGNTHKSYVVSALDGDDGELVDQSPADVMKALNLTSALTDVDLGDDAEGEGGSEEYSRLGYELYSNGE
jgi:hypothetical protein